jgi:hypothetical protein
MWREVSFARPFLHWLRDLHVDFDSFLVLSEVAEHFSIVFQPTYFCGEQLVQPAGEESFGLDQVIHAADEVGMRSIDRSNHHLVPEYEALGETALTLLRSPQPPPILPADHQWAGHWVSFPSNWQEMPRSACFHRNHHLGRSPKRFLTGEQVDDYASFFSGPYLNQVLLRTFVEPLDGYAAPAISIPLQQ